MSTDSGEPAAPAQPDKYEWEDHLAPITGGAHEIEHSRDNVRLIVDEKLVAPVLSALRNAGFDMLVDVTAVDYLGFPDATRRFGVVYALLAIDRGERLFVKTHVDLPEPELPSAVPLWRSAEWLEREVFDMFGIRFSEHPDLRRILLPEEFSSFPLRKDYPLRGRGERHNFPVIARSES